MSIGRFRLSKSSADLGSRSPSVISSPLSVNHWAAATSSIARIAHNNDNPRRKRRNDADENAPPPGIPATPTPASKRARIDRRPLADISCTPDPPFVFNSPLAPSKTTGHLGACSHPQEGCTAWPPTFLEPTQSSTISATPFPSLPPRLYHPQPSTTKPKLTPKQKVDCVLHAIKDVGWGISDFLYFLFLDTDHLSMGHAQTVSKFLKGETKYTPANIIKLWFVHSAGRLLYDADRAVMYSADVPWTEIKPVRPALTSFASQKVLEKCVYEAKLAAKPTSGLHASARNSSKHKLQWRDTGLTTFENAQGIIQAQMPLSYRLLLEITGDLDSKVDDDERPSQVVVTHALSSLLFKRSNEARLLPLSVGLLAFAQSAPADFMAYCSRIGYMPSYRAISNGLEIMAKDQGILVKQCGRDLDTAGFIVMDNVQNYHKVRDQRIGSGNKMNIGIAATYCVLRDIDPDAVKKALDINDKRRRVAEGLRSTLTVPKLLSFLDMPHINTVCILHWMLVLVNHIPQLSSLKAQVSKLFRSRAGRIQIPEGATPVYPLSSSGKCETVTTELKEAMHDFLSQIGQEKGDFMDRLVITHGDGLTFQRLLEVQRYLQFHKDNLESLATVEPGLAFWHTAWTYLSSLFEVHDDGSHSSDPSSLGHSRSLIGRALPGNVKKIDWFPGVDIVNLVLDTRILDCWRLHYKTEDIFSHFSMLSAKNKLPRLDEIEKVATDLHHAYSTTHAIYNALNDTTVDSRWTQSVPLGTEWSSPILDPTTAVPTPPASKPSTNGRHAKGDRVLANSMTFMRDALFSREISYATAEGDAGRVYEIMKMLLFYFAGGSHQKYCSYMLEVVSRFELESSNELREMILKTTLVNLSGLPGSCLAADIMQEYFNRLLEAVIEKKGIDYGDTFARRVISPNLAHFAHLKLNLRSGVGLAPRSGRHTAPNEDPEVQKLLEAYRRSELHMRRPGRVFKDTDRDDFARGLTKLEGGRLKKWVHDTMLQRADTSVLTEDLGDVEDGDGDGDANEGLATLGTAEVIDGHLVIQSLSFTSDMPPMGDGTVL